MFLCQLVQSPQQILAIVEAGAEDDLRVNIYAVVSEFAYLR